MEERKDGREKSGERERRIDILRGREDNLGDELAGRGANILPYRK